jgi:TP901 family phage tail tape measure protein
MTESLPGLELFLSSDKAVAGATKFRDACESAAQACERIGAAADKLQGRLDGIGGAAKAGADPLRKLGEEAGKSNEKFRSGSEGADRMGRSIGGLGRVAGSVTGQIVALLGAAGAISGIASGIAAFSSYEDKLRILGSVSGATESELRKLEQAALDLSRSTRFSPREALQGLTELARAGLGANQAIVALKPTADLARAGLIGLDQSATVVIRTLNQFQLGVEQSARVADVLAKAANMSAGASVDSLADSLAKTGPVARQFNIALEDTVAAVAKLQDGGLAANIAGTGLQRTLIQLRSPTAEAQRALAGLGLTTAQINPEANGLVGVLRNLADANITVQDAVSLVGTEFASLLTVLVGSADGIDRFGAALRAATGDAAKQAAAGNDTLAASFADLRSASEQFAVSAGRGGIGGVLSAITRTGAAALRILADDKKAMEEAGIAAQSLAVGLQLAAVGAIAFGTAKLAAFLNTARVAMLGLNAAVRANPFVATASAIAAVVSAFVVFGGGADDATAKAEEQRDRIKELDEQYRSLSAIIAKVAGQRGEFATAPDPQAFREARDSLAKLGAEIEKLDGKSVDLKRVLAVSGLDTSSELAKIRQLVEEVPRIQAIAAQVGRDAASQLGARPAFSALEAADRRRAEAARVEKGVLDTLAASFANLGVETNAGGEQFLSYEKALAIVRQGLAQLDEAAKTAGVSLAKVGTGQDGIGSAVAGLVAEREKELRIAELTGIEREKAMLFAEAEKRAGAALSDAESKRLATLAEQVVASQKLVEQRRREAAEAERVAKQQEAMPKNVDALRAKYEDQLRIAQAEGVEREIVRAEIEAANAAK